jgi:uncharacterized OB-fold protein
MAATEESIRSGAVAAPPVVPAPSPLTQFFWDGVAEHKLMILKCDNCGKFVHWPRPVCRFCLGTELTPTEVSGRGTIATFTIPMQPYDPFWIEQMPYVLAVVELEEQAHLQLVTNIVDIDADDVRIGMPVEVTYREVAPELTLPQFRPIGAPSAAGSEA